MHANLRANKHINLGTKDLVLGTGMLRYMEEASVGQHKLARAGSYKTLNPRNILKLVTQRILNLSLSSYGSTIKILNNFFYFY